jgi:hypothetical protein
MLFDFFCVPFIGVRGGDVSNAPTSVQLKGVGCSTPTIRIGGVDPPIVCCILSLTLLRTFGVDLAFEHEVRITGLGFAPIRPTADVSNCSETISGPWQSRNRLGKLCGPSFAQERNQKRRKLFHDKAGRLHDRERSGELLGHLPQHTSQLGTRRQDQRKTAPCEPISHLPTT